jgi:hypothetical protein
MLHIAERLIAAATGGMNLFAKPLQHSSRASGGSSKKLT